MSVDDLIGWLRQQLDADERNAKSYLREVLETRLEYDARFRLADIDAKRRILDRLRGEDGFWRDDIASGTAEPVVRLLALPYADRPGYREEWRP